MRLAITRTDDTGTETVELWGEGTWDGAHRREARARCAELTAALPESARPELRQAGDTAGTVSYACRAE